MIQNIAILDTELLDLLFHPAFSRSNNQVAVFLFNAVINTEEDPEPDDENMVDEGCENNIEFSEAHSTTNTDIAERHLTTAEEDGNIGDDFESDPFQFSFSENLEDEAIPFSSVGVDSAESDSINSESSSNNNAIDHSFNEEENQNTISNDSLAITVIIDQSNYTLQNVLLTTDEHNDLNVENLEHTLENSSAFVENEKAI